MPPKDISNNTPIFFSDDGKTFQPLGEITELNITSDDDYTTEQAEAFLKLRRTINEAGDFLMPWGMIEFLVPCLGRREMLSIMMGRKITNNWLKMHGLPMERKRRRIKE